MVNSGTFVWCWSWAFPLHQLLAKVTGGKIRPPAKTFRGRDGEERLVSDVRALGGSSGHRGSRIPQTWVPILTTPRALAVGPWVRYSSVWPSPPLKCTWWQHWPSQGCSESSGSTSAVLTTFQREKRDPDEPMRQKKWVHLTDEKSEAHREELNSSSTYIFLQGKNDCVVSYLKLFIGSHNQKINRGIKSKLFIMP